MNIFAALDGGLFIFACGSAAATTFPMNSPLLVGHQLLHLGHHFLHELISVDVVGWLQPGVQDLTSDTLRTKMRRRIMV